ncbi:MAG: flippase-like domain-containing protein [Polaromonas sp.]|nr:flippase-like domain-containing protein [Polaromonas sp.]
MQESHQTPPAYKGLLKQALILTLALGLLWYAFKGIDLNDIWNYAKNLKPFPVFLVIVSGVFGNFLRSYRWTLLLRPLKAESEPNISQFNSFYAVAIGYAVNVFAPRGGEVARLLSICKSEKLPWAGVLPTLLIDRLLDVAFLLAVFGLTLLILPPALLNAMPWLQSGGLVLLIVVIVGLVAMPFTGTIFQGF